ncbi:MBL fold metallo-hydrolase [Scopulibacillus cellulosilyticus]|uniref:MBL fold metallo-hydrolase n=1 Tax=Scopulibacillus cellulosilyticus TaxID=2665665 RepID=A0ABW2PXF0_9BACL
MTTNLTNEVIIKVLGTAQDAGVPHAGCYCDHCRAALENPHLKRFAAALAIVLPEKQKWHLIDATPDVREQMNMMKEDYPNMGLMSSILLTHAHIGHYTGLMFLGREAIYTNKLPVFAGAKMAEVLRNDVPWKQLVDLENIQIEDIRKKNSFQLESCVEITPLDIPHRNEYSETFGFIIKGPNKKCLYIPDIDRWEQWDKDLKEVAANVDYCLLDATFYSEKEPALEGLDYREIPHPCITNTMDLLEDVVKSNPVKVYFTHFNHTNPVVDFDDPKRDIIKERGFFIADEGITFTL